MDLGYSPHPGALDGLEVGLGRCSLFVLVRSPGHYRYRSQGSVGFGQVSMGQGLHQIHCHEQGGVLVNPTLLHGCG